MALPELTHLQFAILSILLGGSSVSGREVRQRLLEDDGTKLSLASFYQAMARMEKEGYVGGFYETKIENEHLIKERKYKILGLGQNAWIDYKDFCTSKFELGG